MKNLIISILILTLTVSLLPAAATAERVYLNETFSDSGGTKSYTFTANGSGDSKASASVVTDTVTGNDYAYIKKNDADYGGMMEFKFDTSVNNVVLEADIKVPQPGSPGYLFYIKDTVSGLKNPHLELITLNTNGTLRFDPQSKKITKSMTDKEKWYHIAFVMDLESKSYMAYFEGEPVTTAAITHSRNIYELTLLRFQLSGSGPGDLCVDNVKVYEGTAVRDISSETPALPRRDVYTRDISAIGYLGSMTAVHGSSGYIYTSGAKTSADTVYAGDDVCLTPADASGVLGCDITADESAVYCDGIAINIQPVLRDGMPYVPIEQTAGALGKYTVNDLRGLILVSDTEITLTDDNINEINDYMFHERYSAAEIYSLYTAKNQPHPRLLTTKADLERIRDDYRIAMNPIKNEAMGYARYMIQQDTPVRDREFSGDRLLNTSKEVIKRILSLSFTYYVSPEINYKNGSLQKAIAELDNVCNEEIYPDWNHKVSFLDAAEMCFAVSLGYDWLYDELTDTQRANYEAAIRRNYLEPANEYAYYSKSSSLGFWRSTEINWSGVCHGSAAIAAMAIMDTDPAFCSDIISKALRGLEYSLYGVGPDGSWHEGTGYLSYYLQYLTRFLSSAEITLGTDFGFFDFRGMDRLMYFYPSLISNTPGRGNNIHDTGNPMWIYAFAHYFANVYDNPDFSAIRHRDVKAELGVAGYEDEYNVEDAIWCNYFGNTLPENMDRDIYYRGEEIVSVRENYTDTEAMFTSFHGGAYKQSHDHVDAGTFVYDVLGKRWAADIGYSSGGHGVSYRTRAEGHNTVVINPGIAREQDDDGFAAVETFINTDSACLTVMDMSSYYKSTVSSYDRAFYAADSRRSLTVYDDITLSVDDAHVYWFMHFPAAVEITDLGDGIYRMTQGDKSVIAAFEVNTEADIYVAAATPLSTSTSSYNTSGDENYKKFVVEATASGNVKIAVKLSPEGEGISCAPDYSSIGEIMLIDPVSVWETAEGTQASFEAYVPGELSGHMILAFYKGDMLVKAVTKPVTVTGAPDIYSMTGKCADYDSTKAFFWNLDTLMPYTKTED